MDVFPKYPLIKHQNYDVGKKWTAAVKIGSKIQAVTTIYPAARLIA